MCLSRANLCVRPYISWLNQNLEGTYEMSLRGAFFAPTCAPTG